MAPPAGLEPATSWLTVMRSTDWAKEEYIGDPYEIRTRVAGVRGRSLRPLDQRATDGTPSRARTVDTLIKSQVLYQLS